MHIRKKYTKHFTPLILFLTQSILYDICYDLEPKIKYTTHTLQFKTKNSLSLSPPHSRQPFTQPPHIFRSKFIMQWFYFFFSFCS